MNKRLRAMIDEIFSEMKMTAENLALRDELMANAQDRYADAMARGASEEAAFAEIASSLEDVQGLLEEMARADAQQEDAPAPQEPAPQPEAAGEKEPAQEQPGDLGGALGKAFTALGDFSQAIMPEAKKLYGQMDDVTGGVLGKLGRAAKKGMQDAQKAAGEAIDKLSRESGELVFDFGANKEPKPAEPKSDEAAPPQEAPQIIYAEAASGATEPEGEMVMEIPVQESGEACGEAAKLRAEADDLRAQAIFKDVTGDAENAKALRDQAEQLCNQAALLEQSAALESARQAAEQAVQDNQESQADMEERATGADGEIDEDAFFKAVDDLTQQAEQVIHQAARSVEDAADYLVRGADEPVSGRQAFPAAGLHRIDIQLDADDVEIAAGDGTEVETLWEARNVDGEPAVTMENHVLIIRRKNPDVFKTFFSAFQKAGGKITVRVPRGYGLCYAVTTTSGDVRLGDLDVDDVTVNTASGSVRIEPNARVRAADLSVTTVSGYATVSAMAETIKVNTVSGGQFISCDAHKVEATGVSGKLHAEGACDEWEISGVSNEAELLCTVAPTKKIQISSVHADVRVALPDDIRGFAAEISSLLGGGIVNEFGPNRYGTCALPIRMETLHGKLLITRL